MNDRRIRISASALWAACAVSLVISIAAAGRSAIIGYSLQRPDQFWDQMATVGLYMQAMSGGLQVSELFRFHNEHRIPLPNLLFMLDGWLFDFKNTFLICITYLGMIGIAAVISVVSFASWLHRMSALLATLGLALGLVQFENLSWGFQVAFPLVHLFALLCFACLARQLSADRRLAALGWGLLAIVFDGLAILTLTSALAIALAALLMPVLMRRWNAAFLCFMAAHAVMALLYLRGESRVHSATSTDKIWTYGRFFLRTLGALARDLPHGPLFLGALLFSGTLLVGLAFLWRAIKDKQSISPSSTALITGAVFIVAEAAMILAGRFNADAEQASVSRYATNSIVLALCLMALAWRSSRSTWARLATALTAVALTVSANLPASRTLWEHTIAQRDEAVFAIMSGVDDKDEMGHLFPNNFPVPGIPEKAYGDLRQMQKGPFAPGSYYMAPPNARARPARSLPPCRGEGRAAPRPSGDIGIAGWAIGPESPEVPKWVLAYAKSGDLVAYTRPTVRRKDLKKAFHASGDRFGFMLFLPRTAADGGGVVYASFKEDGTPDCALGVTP